jgi:hypothetical protein
MSNIDASMVITAAQTKAEESHHAAVKLLLETDWYVLRSAETGKKVPKKVTIARASARQAISDTLTKRRT